MATPTEPVTGALYQALSSPEPDPQVVHAAIEEVRQIASQNVIAVIGAQIAELKAEMKAGFVEINARIDAQGSRLDARITEVRAEIKAQNSRIDVLQRVIWPLIGLLATTVFGLLYRVVIATPG